MTLWSSPTARRSRNIAIARRVADGETLSSVARDLGLSVQRVSNICKPIRQYARVAVYRAVKAGRIERPERCPKCRRRTAASSITRTTGTR